MLCGFVYDSHAEAVSAHLVVLVDSKMRSLYAYLKRTGCTALTAHGYW